MVLIILFLQLSCLYIVSQLILLIAGKVELDSGKALLTCLSVFVQAKSRKRF